MQFEMKYLRVLICKLEFFRPILSRASMMKSLINNKRKLRLRLRLRLIMMMMKWWRALKLLRRGEMTTRPRCFVVSPNNIVVAVNAPKYLFTIPMPITARPLHNTIKLIRAHLSSPLLSLLLTSKIFQRAGTSLFFLSKYIQRVRFGFVCFATLE